MVYKDQLPKNLISNLTFLLVNVLIGLFLVPFFISTLGVAAYGVIPLSTSIMGYASIVIQSLNTAVTRYLSVDLSQKKYSDANKTFNTAFFCLTFIILLSIPFMVVFAFLVPVLFHVPSGQENGTTILIIEICVAFCIRAWSGNYTVQLFAFNRLDLQNLVNLTNLLVQTLLILSLFSNFGPSLPFVGGAYVLGAIISSIIAIFLAHSVCPHLTVSMKFFDYPRMMEMIRMGGWILVNNIGYLLFYQSNLIIVNIFFGTQATGEYAIVYQWVIFLVSIANATAGILVPMFLSFYAHGDTQTLVEMSQSAVKIMGLLLALPIGIICGLSPYLLLIWLGSEYISLSPLFILLTVHLVINLAVLPLFSINVAYNRVRIPGLVNLLFGIVNISLAVFLSITTGWGYYGVALAGSIALTVKNSVFTPWYASRILNVPSRWFISSMIPGIMSVGGIWIVARIIAAIIPCNSLIYIIIIVGFISLFFFYLVWKFFLSNNEKAFFTSYIPFIHQSQSL